MKLVHETKTNRKIFGLMKLSTFIILILCATTVFAIQSFVIRTESNIIVNEACSVDTSLTDSLTLTAGSFYSYNYDITNEANKDLEFLVKVNLSNIVFPLEDGEGRIALINSTDTIIESTLAVDGELILETSNLYFTSGQVKDFDIEIQLNSSADNSTDYKLVVEVIPKEFNFD